jgi:putative ATPase
LLFVDEIHRFNKAQQDAFLPHVESGVIILLGATTENPSFSLTSALLSRVRVLVFPSLSEASLRHILGAGLAATGLRIDDAAVAILLTAAGGDARRLLNLLESFHATQTANAATPATADAMREFLANAPAYIYDRAGDQHFDMISAFIKSLRGSDPDAALYWGFRMLESGDDPRYVLRRMMIFASEDIGNADVHALPLAVATADAFDRLGVPEGLIPIAQCITYLATAPKSNRSLMAMSAALSAVKEHPRVTVPIHLRNAPTELLKDLGHGEGYLYPHDAPNAFVAGVECLPPEIGRRVFYSPGDQGDEAAIAKRMRDRGQR